MNLLRVLEQVFGRNSRYYLSIAALKWAETGSIMVGGPSDPEGAWNPAAAIEKRHQRVYVTQLDFAEGILLAALDHVQQAGIESVYDGKNTPRESSEIVRLVNLIDRQFRKLIRARPECERDLQDAFENLLVGAEIPYSREADVIEYSSKTYRPDFTFSRIGLALELKLCNKSGREKEMIAEINDDILAYSTKSALCEMWIRLSAVRIARGDAHSRHQALIDGSVHGRYASVSQGSSRMRIEATLIVLQSTNDRCRSGAVAHRSGVRSRRAQGVLDRY